MRRILPILLASLLFGCPKNEPDKKSDNEGKSDKADKKKDDGDKADKKKDDGDKADKTKPEQEEEPQKPVGPPPVCTVNAQKTWGKGVNMLTGLTAVPMTDGKTAIGFALGNTPQVLVVGSKGEGKLVKVAVDKDSVFAAKAPKGPGSSRALFRVTPTKIDGATAHAFVDFRDQYKIGDDAKALAEKGKRVVCGPADSSDKWVLDEGPAWFDDPKTNKDPLAAIVDHLGKAGVANPAGTYSEVRDCRTFYDAKRDEIWIVGSRFEMKIGADGAASDAFSELFVESGKNGALKGLHKTPIKIEKALKVVDYEVPVSHELADGSYVVAARVGFSALVAAQLEHDKVVRGTFKTYQGYFNMPDAAEDGPDDVLMASLKIGKDAYALRAMRILGTKSELPAAFSKVTTDEDESHSESRPEFLRDAKGQRWVAYIENAEKGKGHLEVIPVTAGFRASGRPYAVTKEDEKTTEARLVAQKDGGFLVVYIRDNGNGVGELVTEDLDCKVEK